MAASSRSTVLSLYKKMLKESQKFTGYNFRNYALRRVKDGFKEHKQETDVKTIDLLILKAEENLQIIKRQMSFKNSRREMRSSLQGRQEDKMMHYDTSDVSDSESECDVSINRRYLKNVPVSSSKCCHSNQSRGPQQSNRRKMVSGPVQNCSDNTSASVGDVSITIVEHHIECRIRPTENNDDDDDFEDQKHALRNKKCAEKQLKHIEPALNSVGLEKTNIGEAIKVLRQLRLGEIEQRQSPKNERQSCNRNEGTVSLVNQRKERDACRNRRRFKYSDSECSTFTHENSRRGCENLGSKSAPAAILPVPPKQSRPGRRALMSSLSDHPASESVSSSESGFHTFSTTYEDRFDDDLSMPDPMSPISQNWSSIQGTPSFGQLSPLALPSSGSSEGSTPLPPLKKAPKLRRKKLLPPLITRPTPEPPEEMMTISSPRFAARVDDFSFVPRNTEYVRMSNKGPDCQSYDSQPREVVFDYEIGMPSQTWSHPRHQSVLYEKSVGEELQRQNCVMIQPVVAPSPRPRAYRVFDFIPENCINRSMNGNCENIPLQSPRVAKNRLQIPEQNLTKRAHCPRRNESDVLRRTQADLIIPFPPSHLSIHQRQRGNSSLDEDVPFDGRAQSYGHQQLRRPRCLGLPKKLSKSAENRF